MTVKFHEILKMAFDKGYRVTEDGRLIGLKGNELTIRCRGNQRYPTFSINVGNLTESGVFGIPVHRFAAYCFYGESMFEDGKVVRHLDADPLNVSKDNLIIGTPSENEHDKPIEVRRRTGRIARAAQGRPNNSKFTDDQVREIRNRSSKGESGAVIAKDYGVTRNCIYSIIKGRNYSNVD